MTAHISMLLKSHASLTCFRACFLPGWAKDLSASRYSRGIDRTAKTLTIKILVERDTVLLGS